MKRKYTQQEVERLMIGRIYANPNDLNIFVRRRGLASWTLNFANKWAWALIVAINLIAALIVLALR